MKIVNYTAMSNSGRRKVDYWFFPQEQALIFEMSNIREGEEEGEEEEDSHIKRGVIYPGDEKGEDKYLQAEAVMKGDLQNDRIEGVEYCTFENIRHRTVDPLNEPMKHRVYLRLLGTARAYSANERDLEWGIATLLK